MGTISSLQQPEGWIGGARRDRTADLLHAMQALSQLSYGPTKLRARILASPGDLRKHFFGFAIDHRTQFRVQCNALVEHETAALVALPADPFKPAQDAAVQLQHVVQPVLAHPQRGLLAADAAGAETDHGRTRQRLPV